MIIARFDNVQFQQDMDNIVKYSLGFLEGARAGKTAFLAPLGAATIEMMKDFIDANARLSPEALHHIYEWNQTGSPDARLYDINYTVSNLGLSFKSTFSQSTSIKSGSNVPFYDKARIMEQGIEVTIKPVASKVLAFEENGETVFTRGPVTIENPGGTEVQGSFESVFDNFFRSYFSQAFLNSSGILDKIQNPVAFKRNMAKGKRGGRSAGYQTGYRWIANAGALK